MSVQTPAFLMTVWGVIEGFGEGGCKISMCGLDVSFCASYQEFQLGWQLWKLEDL